MLYVELLGECNILEEGELRDLYTAHNNIRAIKYRKLQWTEGECEVGTGAGGDKSVKIILEKYLGKRRNSWDDNWLIPFHIVYRKIWTVRIFSMARQPLVGQGLINIEASRSHFLDTPHSVGLLWTSDQPDAETSTWKHSQQTDIHAPGWIRTRSSNKPAAADPCLRPRGHWDRRQFELGLLRFISLNISPVLILVLITIFTAVLPTLCVRLCASYDSHNIQPLFYPEQQ